MRLRHLAFLLVTLTTLLLPISSYTSYFCLRINFSSLPQSSSFTRWRTSTLGTGADYATLKLNHLRSLTSKILNSDSRISSCAVLSNCARFDVLLSSEDLSDADIQSVNELVATTLVQESEHYVSNTKELSLAGSLINSLRLLLDLSPSFSTSPEPPSPSKTNQILSNISTLNSTSSILTYLSLAAAGMNNPKRNYNPYNSCDSHIMLQLKRTLQCTSSVSAYTVDRSVDDLIKVAIKCGAIARNENQCSIIKELKEYGGKYSGDAPCDLLERVTDEVFEDHLKPIISEFVNFESNDINDMLIFQTKSNAIAKNLNINSSTLNKIIHEPTLLLKNNEPINENIKSRINDLQNELVLGEAILIRNESQLGSFVNEGESPF